MCNERPWWKRPLRVIQTNLQVLDTPRMDEARIAAQIEDLGANVLVVNVGGIYAWYPTALPFHTVNPCLPKDHDLLEALLAACHARGIRVVARFDFSKASDRTYQMRPQWFARSADGSPQVVGAMRPGNWDLLYTTCINSGYRNAELAAPALREALGRYDLDGVFFNAPHAPNCHCEACKAKYLALYGAPLPDDEAQWDPGWKSRCLYDNIGLLRKAIRETRDVPVILYYGIASDNLYERLATCDMICAEPQDVLSLGWKEIPQSFKPALCIRLGRSEPAAPPPFGIIHSCPGMDWRHVGLPPAEYLYWMSQVPANGGYIWHSITGIPDTIGDKRILECVRTINTQIRVVEGCMDGARSRAPVALLWDMHADDLSKAFGGQMTAPANGWAEAMLSTQIPFDVLLPEQVASGRLAEYRVAVLPTVPRDAAVLSALEDFVAKGGRVVAECSRPLDARPAELLGLVPGGQVSEYLQASYLRFAPGAEDLRRDLGPTPLLPHRGRTLYAQPRDARTLCTLVPPFAPMEAVGAPPERASLPVPETDLPLLTLRQAGEGCAAAVLFPLSAMLSELKLHDHELLVRNLLTALLGDALDIRLAQPLRGIQLMDYQGPSGRVIHVVNGIGQRPLSQNLPLQVELVLRWEKDAAPRVRGLLCGEPEVRLEGGELRIRTAPVQTWEVLTVEA